MNTMTKYETIADIETALFHLRETNGIIRYISEYTPGINQFQINLPITINDITIQYLESLKESLKEDKND